MSKQGSIERGRKWATIQRLNPDLKYTNTQILNDIKCFLDSEPKEQEAKETEPKKKSKWGK